MYDITDVKIAFEQIKRLWLTYPGVRGIKIGVKIKNDKIIQPPCLCIIVFVQKKGQYKPECEIPKFVTIEKLKNDKKMVPTDVLEVDFQLMHN